MRRDTIRMHSVLHAMLHVVSLEAILGGSMRLLVKPCGAVVAGVIAMSTARNLVRVDALRGKMCEVQERIVE